MKIVGRDLAARVLTGDSTYPAFYPTVYGESAPDAEGIVVNAYRIWTDRWARRITSKKVGEYLRYGGFVLPESGWKQIDKYGDDEVTNEDIVDVQSKMDFPVVAPLPSTRVRDAVLNARIARSISNKALFLEIPAFWTEKDVNEFVVATRDWAWGYGTSYNHESIERIVRIAPRSKIIVVL